MFENLCSTSAQEGYCGWEPQTPGNLRACPGTALPLDSFKKFTQKNEITIKNSPPL
jgi:hypothetical protein